MKKKAGFALRSVCGESFLIAEGIDNIDFSELIYLNETSVFLWNAMGDGEFTADALLEVLVSEYDVTEEQAREDIDSLLTELTEVGVLES